MALTFPNPTRSFDKSRNAVRFVGYEGVFEIPFFVQAAALAKLNAPRVQPDKSEATSLCAFDAHRAFIQDVARETHSHSRSNAYVLTSADFRT